MTHSLPRLTLLFALAYASSASAQDQPAPFLEAGGLIVMEAESMPYDSNFWSLETSIDGYRGSGYLVGQENHLRNPGFGIIRYPFRVSTTGNYQLQWRSRITAGTSNTDLNDTWSRMTDDSGATIAANENDLEPTGQWYKVYMNQAGRWSNQSSNHDNNPRALHWTLESGKTYYFEISVRSEGHGIDRIVLYRRGTHFFSTLTGRIRNNVEDNDTILDNLPESQRVPLDDDNDGLSNDWEALHAANATALDPGSDADQDKLTALQEFLLGTDPNEYSPLPQPSIIEQDGSQWFALDFSLSPDALHLVDLNLRYSPDLVEWTSDGIVLETGLSDPDPNAVSAARARIPSQELAPAGFFHLGAAKR